MISIQPQFQTIETFHKAEVLLLQPLSEEKMRKDIPQMCQFHKDSNKI